MGKGGGAPEVPSKTKTTVVPFLKNDVIFAADQARNLFEGLGPEGVSLQNQISDLTSQITSLQDRARRPTRTDTGLFGGRRTIQGGISEAEQTELDGLINQRADLRTQLSNLSPNLPQFFPGETFVNFTPEQEEALLGIADRARDGSPIVDAAQDLTLSTLQGDFLNGNPFIDDVISGVTRDLGENFNDVIVPTLNANFGLAGRTGGGARGLAFGDATQNFLNSVGDVSSRIRFDNFNQERARQQQASALAPALASSDFTDLQALLGVGESRQSLEAAKLQDEIDRFNFDQNIQGRMLDDFINRIGALNSGSGTQTTTGPAVQQPGTSPILGGLGGAATGLGLASTLTNAGVIGSGATGALAGIGGPVGIGLGVLGGLAGLFG